ncbi:MAG TPA: TonB-dependent receptor [Lysobacter sp.]|jgi:iron complex outermembrane receptor protein|nr:TonB-dependent receptor [Lysobacter sp.]
MIKPLSASIACILLASTVTTNARAQEATEPAVDSADQEEKGSEAVDLDKVIVTGTRSPKAIDKIPGAITVVSKQEVERTLSLTEDATAVLARSVPGYSEASQAMSNTGETLRGRIALRLFDGIPQTSPLREGNRSGTFTDMGLVGRIEVINGPSASEGIGAAGGIINYLSKVPTKEGSETTLTTRYGGQDGSDSEGWKLGLTYAYKADAFDVLASGSYIDRGISYDGHGRRIGMNASGSISDSQADNLFLKFGWNFGEGGVQRLQASFSRFNVTGNGNYHWVPGDRAQGITDTAERGSIFGSKTEFNDFTQYVLAYTHGDFFGGTLKADIYKADQAMRYPAENGDDRQDPLIAPRGELWDQSEIHSNKKGVRTSWTRPQLFGVEGLELRTGVDVVEDETEQRLALTDRVWVPPMTYKSTAPYLQLSQDIGRLTLSGGFRREDGELSVDDYTTTWFRDRRFVSGGTLSYNEDLVNFGAIVRLPAGFSVFASYGEGFGLPNVGIPLRNIQCSNDSPEGTQPDGCPNDPPISVAGILDLQAIVVDNREYGINWQGARGSFGLSHYDSHSDFGVSLSVDPVSRDFVMNRAPVDIEGYEFSGEYSFSDQWKISGLYSRIRGKTWFVKNGPLDKEMGINDISPDKIGAALTWNFLPHGNVILGATKLLDRDINEGTSAEEHTKGYTLYDLSVNYDMEKYGKLTLGVENLTDKFYILSWSQIDFYRNYFAGRGRMISLTHTITF